MKRRIVIRPLISSVALQEREEWLGGRRPSAAGSLAPAEPVIQR
ncbi:hypothetical protein [Mesosutterella multiformis]|nr:hypothetical protein [Mesosutterella multiformis]